MLNDQPIANSEQIEIALPQPELNETEGAALSGLTAEEKQKVHTTYQSVLEEVFAREVWNVLQEMNKQFAIGGRYASILDDPQFLASKAGKALLEAQAAIQADIDDSKEPSYTNVTALCHAIEGALQSDAVKAVEGKNKAVQKGTQIAAHNFSERALSQIYVIKQFNVPKIVQNLNTITTMGEAHHTVNRKKKSWWRRMIDAVVRFVRGETKQEILEAQQRLGSIQKAATEVAGRYGVKLFTEGMKQNLEQVAAAERYEEGVEKKQNVELNIDSKMEVPPPQPGMVRQVLGGAAKAGKNIGVAVGKAAAQKMAEKISEKLPTFMSFTSAIDYVAGKDEATRHVDLNTHVRSVFENQAKTIAYDTLHSFVTEMYLAYETIGRMMENHPGIQIDYEALGFGHLAQPEFKIFMEKMARSLGYDIEDFKKNHPDWEAKHASMPLAIHLMVYATEEEKQAARARFMEGDAEKGIGAQQAATIFTDEYNRMNAGSVSDKTKNVHYNLLVDKSKQVVEQLQTKERMQKAISIALENLEPKFYDPSNQTFKTEVLGHLKQDFVKSLESNIAGFLAGPKQAQAESTHLCEAINQSMRDEMTKMLQAHYMPKWKEDPVLDELLQPQATIWSMLSQNVNQLMGWSADTQDKRERVIPHAQTLELNRDIERKQITTRNQEWTLAGANVDKSGMPRMAKQTMMNVLQKETEATWRKESQQVLQTMFNHMGGREFILELNNKLTEQYATTTNPQTKRELEQTLMVFANVIQTSDLKKLNDLSFAEYKLFFDGACQAANAIYAQKSFRTIEEQADMYMLSKALSSAKSAYVTPAMALSAYQNIYQTTFDSMTTTEMGFMMQKIYEEAGKMCQQMSQDFFSGSIDQFAYYIAERNKQKEQRARDPLYQGRAPEEETIAEKGMLGKVYDTAAMAAYYAAYPLMPVTGAYKVASTTTMFSLDVIKAKMAQRTDAVKDEKSFNKILVDCCQETIREQSFEAMFNMVSELHDLYGLIERGQQHTDENLLKKYGLGKAEDVSAFLNKVSQHLGFKDVHELALSQSLSREGGTLYEQKKAAFAKLPETEAEKREDPFVYLKNDISAENARLNQAIKGGELNAVTQYLVLVSAMDSIVCDVQLLQRETLAVDMLAPNIDETIGFDSDQAGWWAAMKETARERAQSFAVQQAQQGVMSKLQGSIAVANEFATGFIAFAKEGLDRHLQSLQAEAIAKNKKAEEDLNKIKNIQQVSAFIAEHKDYINDATFPKIASILVSKNDPALIQVFADIMKKSGMSEYSINKNFLLNAVREMSENKTYHLAALMAPFIFATKPELNDEIVALMTAANNGKSSDMPNPKFGWLQYASDQDWPKLLEIRELYVFLEQAYKSQRNEAWYIIQEIDEIEAGIRDVPSIEELASLKEQYQAAILSLERYEGGLEALQEQLREQIAIRYEDVNPQRRNPYLEALAEQLEPEIKAFKKEKERLAKASGNLQNIETLVDNPPRIAPITLAQELHQQQPASKKAKLDSDEPKPRKDIPKP
ncbi:hypothetical protein CC99x_011855 [Candidatus Berkiella cookevillensis]|uniref:Uncharacterized protein n=1 Tax=Candidatus Berkiella cookevillensis TaxID=437022 RepID=A0A0Q9YLK0_9GAMM|nr:hypothetical protein [Candidatus Berkiella cookevillensis]MCS5709590.1 hypothetical protein [Candidatus Berkiella cookevillensis]